MALLLFARVDRGEHPRRRCVLISPTNRPMRPIGREIREWIIAQLRADIEAIDLLYPQLGLLAAGY
jgi:hypothetical protein